MSERHPRSKIALVEVILPLAVMLIGTALCRLTDLDLDLSQRFYDPVTRDWPASEQPLLFLSYQWGPIFSAVAAFWALFHLFASYLHPRFWAKRAVSLFVLLSILIGPVLVVNGLVKETWRRPRPRDTVQFGGTHEFRRVLEFGQREYRGKSFPGGHASAGFVLVLFYFLWKRQRPKMAGLALLFGIGWGSWLSYVRIAAGGHFLSDNLYAFGLNWFVIWGLFYFWYLPYRRRRLLLPTFRPSPRRYAIGSGLLLVAAAALAFRFFFSVPFRIDYPEQVTELPSALSRVTIRVRAEKGNITIRHGDPDRIAVVTWIKGHALPNIQAERQLTVNRAADRWEWIYTVAPSGFYYEFQSHTTVYVPRDRALVFDLFTKQGAVFRDDLQPVR